MTHLAYPNAKMIPPSEFIGCGRFIASEQKPEGYEYSSKIIDNEKPENAARILAYESFQTNKIICEKKDRPEYAYQGTSLHLAYLLALISRSRKIRLKTGTDIWSTGSIEVTDGNPFLNAVISKGFDIKLRKGFLSDENQDTLFIVPEANFLPSHQELCDQKNVKVFSIEQFREQSPEYDFQRKTILKVRSDELYALISLVFEMGPNPYKGLEYFDEKDAERFFGRDEVILELFHVYQNLCSSPMRLMAILGPSGSGKSSIARAGLIPKIREHKKDISLIVFRPDSHPLLSLAKGLANVISKNQFIEKIWKRPKQTNKKGEYDALSTVADEILELISAPLVMIIDQFEEIYSMCEDRQEGSQFINKVIQYAVSDKYKHLSIIIIFRSDFLGQAQSHPDLSHALARKTIIVPAMRPNNLRAVIAEPARRSGYLFDVKIVDELISQTEGHEGALPLLEFALSAIWQGMEKGVRPEKTLKAINGVGGALAKKAQELYDSLGEQNQRIIRRTFLRLINIGEGMFDTRRRVLLSDITAHKEDSVYVRKVLEIFSAPGARLITLSSDLEDRETAEITHESLFEHWDLLKKWIRLFRKDILFHRRLSDAAHNWNEKGRATGYLWRSHVLDESKDFYHRCSSDMTTIETKFYHASVYRKKLDIIIKHSIISMLIMLTLIAGGLAYHNFKLNEEIKKKQTSSVLSSADLPKSPSPSESPSASDTAVKKTAKGNVFTEVGKSYDVKKSENIPSKNLPHPEPTAASYTAVKNPAKKNVFTKESSREPEYSQIGNSSEETEEKSPVKPYEDTGDISSRHKMPSVGEEYRVKMGFIFNFAKFVEWEEEDLSCQGNKKDLLLCVASDKDEWVDEWLGRILFTQHIGNTEILLKECENKDDVENCNILFLASTNTEFIRERLDKIKDRKGILTVGEMEGFLQLGGMINFVTESERINLFSEKKRLTFEINLNAANRSRLKLRGQLLSTARKVEGNQ
jgi:hypothetical protein